MKRILLKTLVALTFILCSANISAQDIDMSASVDMTPPLSIGQTFTYTIETLPGRPYRGVQVYLNYNTSVIQLNSLTPDNSVLFVPLVNDTATPGVIRYSSGAFTDVTVGTVLFTAEFEVVSTSGSVMIEHDLLANGNPNGTAVADSDGANIIGITNDIILSTLSVGQSEFSNGISLFPIPVNDVLNIKLNASQSEIDNIKVFSIDGKLVQQHNAISLIDNLVKLDASQLDSAIYFVTITSTENELATFKMVVN